MKDYYRSSASENISDDRPWAQDRSSGVGGSSRWENFWFSAQTHLPHTKIQRFSCIHSNFSRLSITLCSCCISLPRHSWRVQTLIACSKRLGGKFEQLIEEKLDLMHRNWFLWLSKWVEDEPENWW